MERSKLKKAIIFDCDNTLWEGVIGEGQITKYPQIEEFIISLAKRGVIIGICSKNNESDLTEALSPLNPYISTKRINWKDKASNLKEIAQELNIGLDAIVFVDDSEFEINLVKKELPEILSISPGDLIEVVTEYFDLSGSITKTQQYKENYDRAKAEDHFTDIRDYLASLEMVISIKVNEHSHVPRIAELTQKTNQFNLTTKRYTEDQIKGLMPWIKIYTLSVKDKFGDHGITGVCIVMDNQISNFLLSCRILGKGIEYAFMDYIIEDLKKSNHKYIFGKYVPSEKNMQSGAFYPSLGFMQVHSVCNEKIYYIDLQNYTSKAEKHFRYE